MLRVTRLSKTYSTTVVNSVDWQLEAGRVHALLGGNGSGKSTLLKMIAGVVPADPGGEIELLGQRYDSEKYGPHASRALRFVHQDLALVDDLSIADNFGLAREFPRSRLGRIDDRALVTHVASELAKRGLDLDPRLPVASLRSADRTLVAIARALDGIGDGPTTLVLDEPTASLPIDEVVRLFDSIRALRDGGHSVVFVSHRLSEVAEIADDVTILRDGRVVGRGPIAEFSESRIVELIAGHVRGERTTHLGHARNDGHAALVATDILAGPLKGVDITVRSGEIVGLAGLVGSGRSSLLRAIFGDLDGAGAIAVDGVPTSIRSTGDAVRARIALVPEDRQRDAAFLDRPVWENLSAAVLTRYRRWGRLSARQERSDAPAIMHEYRVRAPSPAISLAALSGGNQQKVIVARWMSADPRVLLLDEPTQGVDAVARDEIHELVRAAARRGTAVVVVSSDLDELEELSDRVLVLVDGRIARELTGSDVNRGLITTAMHETGVPS
ncbi:monosaccharide ABC transporter ATP-binding protein (CUT2 family) [Homoserinimonas aerilata]|uniref:Monosaccharide ABC transporter ATP-binding protein (CUT2 family) n=1 Tax=Homoserinimonas aerilata TaxID=1162970 RepID=A0A542YH81_9MICO|nr:monosaccharide ABC transporter ATP-binding protein (CUT2 family) [Homoserinimonas aerilata]